MVRESQCVKYIEKKWFENFFSKNMPNANERGLSWDTLALPTANGDVYKFK